jgi:hypothetical protein
MTIFQGCGAKDRPEQFDFRGLLGGAIQTMVRCEESELNSIGHIELVKDVTHMALDRSLADRALLSNVRIGITSDDQIHNLLFAQG